jgi:hypothetical protein
MENVRRQNSFKNLPEIPIHKHWLADGKTTPELLFIQKLGRKENLTVDDLKIVWDLNHFFRELNDLLPSIKYSEFSEQDFADFRNYILFAFNMTGVMGEELTIYQMFRLVVNEEVNPFYPNRSLTHIDQLSYPKADIVKRNNLYNRANTPNSTVFYSCENIDTALREKKPVPNKLVTVGVWKPKKISPTTEKIFISYPISESEEAMKVNDGVRDVTLTGRDRLKNTGAYAEYILNFNKVLGREFTKKVNSKLEYFLSAIFSEQLLIQSDIPNYINYDCIIYPSVETGYTTDNFAFRTDVIHKDFYLDGAIEFEVDIPLYSNPYVPHRPDVITLAKIKKSRVSKMVDNHSGKIYW